MRKLCLWVSHFDITNRSVVSLPFSSSFPALCPLPSLWFVAPHPGICRTHVVHQKPLKVNLPKDRTNAHLHSFVPHFSRPWNQLLHAFQSHSSLQVLKTAIHHHLKSFPIQKHVLFCTHENTSQFSQKFCFCLQLVHTLHSPLPIIVTHIV